MARGRQKLVIDKDEFQKVVSDLESSENFSTLSKLWKAVEGTDWAKNLEPRPLTASVASQRAQELGIEIKTKSAKPRNGENKNSMSRGRQKLVIDKDEFQKVVNDLEDKQEFTRLSDLWKAVEETDWAKNLQPRPLTVAVAIQRARELDIETKTKSAKGKGGAGRGKQKLVLDKDEFQQVVNDLEDKHSFTKASDLWQAVEDSDWAKNLKPRPLTAGVAYQRARELGIETKTKSSKGRGVKEKLVIDKDEFQKVVNDLESKREFKKLSSLWKAVEETDWAKNLKPRPLTAGVAYQRARELGIEVKTKGTKGITKVEVDKDEFQQVVNDLESKQEFNRQSELWAAIEETDWAKNLQPRPLKAQTAAKQAERLGIETKVKKRRRRSESEENHEPNIYDRPDPLNAGVPRPTRGTYFVLAPAGSCPHKLSDTQEDAVVDWATKVVETCFTSDRLMAPTALNYFVSHFYDVFSEDYDLAKEHIQNNKDLIYESIGACYQEGDDSDGEQD